MTTFPSAKSAAALLLTLLVFPAAGQTTETISTTAESTPTATIASETSPTETAPVSTPTQEPVADESTSTQSMATETPEPAALSPETSYSLAVTFPTSKNTPTIPESAATSTPLITDVVYQVLHEGTGAETDTSSTRRIHYILWTADGAYLESTLDSAVPSPFSFIPNTGQAIIGMDQGTEGMRIGEIRKIFIPAHQAYGDRRQGSVPPNTDLIFVVELVDLRNPAEAMETQESSIQ